MRGHRPILLALLVFGLSANAAEASTVRGGGTTVQYTADPGETNSVVVTLSGSNVIVHDGGTDASGQPIQIKDGDGSAGNGCKLSSSSGGNTATCPARGGNAVLDDMPDAATLVGALSRSLVD